MHLVSKDSHISNPAIFSIYDPDYLMSRIILGSIIIIVSFVGKITPSLQDIGHLHAYTRVHMCLYFLEKTFAKIIFPVGCIYARLIFMPY